MMRSVMFPSDYFNISTVDDNYLTEYNIAKSLDFRCLLLNYDEYLETGIVKVYGASNFAEKSIVTIYRGWMMTSEQYSELFFELYHQYKIVLLNTPDEYTTCHYFNNEYTLISADTPKIEQITVGGHLRDTFDKLPILFPDGFIIKDNAKSVKNTRLPFRISSAIKYPDFVKVLDEFISERGLLYTGEIILKKYVFLKKYGDVTNEYRAFVFRHKLISVERNSGQSDTSSPPDMSLINKYVGIIPSDFYTIDIGELENGDFTILEMGDGQVSGLSTHQNESEFYLTLQNI